MKTPSKFYLQRIDSDNIFNFVRSPDTTASVCITSKRSNKNKLYEPPIKSFLNPQKITNSLSKSSKYKNFMPNSLQIQHNSTLIKPNIQNIKSPLTAQSAFTPNRMKRIYYKQKLHSQLLQPENNFKEKKSKYLITIGGQNGSARTPTAIQFKRLLYENYDKTTSDFFLKENQLLKNWLENKKSEGFCPHEIFYNQLKGNLMQPDKEKLVTFLQNFSEDWKNLKKSALFKESNVYKFDIFNQIKKINKVLFVQKKKEIEKNSSNKYPIIDSPYKSRKSSIESMIYSSPISSPRRRESSINRRNAIENCERDKFKALVNLNFGSSHKNFKRSSRMDFDEENFENYDYDLLMRQDTDNRNENFYFSPLKPSEINSAKGIIKKITKDKIIDNKLYDISKHFFFLIFIVLGLKKYKDEEERHRLRYFDPLYEKKIRISNFRQKLQNCLIKIRKMRQGDQDPVFVSNKPFERKGSIVFFEAIKARNSGNLINLLQENPLYVFDINTIQQTGLHIACKKGFIDIVKILLRNKAGVNAYDLGNRTCLYFAITNGFIDITRYLLFYGAYPFSNKKCNFDLELKNNKILRFYVKKAREIYVTLAFIKEKEHKMALWKQKRKIFCKKTLN